jgi:hypothetical protein
VFGLAGQSSRSLLSCDRVRPADPVQGLFFRAADGSATRVEDVGWNKDRHLLFIVPALPAGDYGMEVRAVVGACGLRVGVLGTVLHVNG